MITDAKLKFWIDNNLNVLFVGAHGTGKTARVKEAFDNAGLKWLYYSAATMDPWVDMIGVPKERTDENGKIYLDLVRPKQFSEDNVEAIFMDEFNRCLTGDTPIQLVNGYSTPIKDLVGKEYFFVYSYDVKNDKIVVGKGHSARITAKNQQIVKVTLDNGMSIRCTKDHPFLLLDGTYKQAQDLTNGISLMPLYKNYCLDKQTDGYESVFLPKQNLWYYTHWLADEYNLINNLYEETSGIVCHHKDFNKSNNSPENIIRMDRSDHFRLHKITAHKGGVAAHKKHPNLYFDTIGNDISREKAIKNSILTRQTSKKYKKLRSKISKRIYTPEMRRYRSQITRQQWLSGQFENIDRNESMEKMHVCKIINILNDRLGSKELSLESYCDIKNSLKGKGKGIISLETINEYFGSFEEFKNHYNDILSKSKNHKVISVEECGREDVYDITVDKYENFAVGQGVFVHNSHAKIRNAVMELIQFKSINGKRFNNLRFVWAAINPETKEENSDDMEYDVERLDPAQKDRFHIIVDVPYKPDKSYFTKKFGLDMCENSIDWWNDLDEKTKMKISPRRLDYTLQVYNAGGDIRDVLPPDSNVSKLLVELKNGSYVKIMKTVFANKDAEEAKKFLAVRNNYDNTIEKIVKSDDLLSFFCPHIKEEDLVNLMANDKSVYEHVVNNYDTYEETIKDILDTNNQPKLSNKLRREPKVEQMANSLKAKVIANKFAKFSFGDIKLDSKPIVKNTYGVQFSSLSGQSFTNFINNTSTITDAVKMGTQYRVGIYHKILENITHNESYSDYMITLKVLADIICSSNSSSLKQNIFDGLPELFGFIVKRMLGIGLSTKKTNVQEIFKLLSISNGRYQKLEDFIFLHSKLYV